MHTWGYTNENNYVLNLIAIKNYNFTDDIIFLFGWEFSYFDSNFAVVPRDPIHNKTALFQVMARRRWADEKVLLFITWRI